MVQMTTSNSKPIKLFLGMVSHCCGFSYRISEGVFGPIRSKYGSYARFEILLNAFVGAGAPSYSFRGLLNKAIGFDLTLDHVLHHCCAGLDPPIQVSATSRYSVLFSANLFGARNSHLVLVIKYNIYKHFGSVFTQTQQRKMHRQLYEGIVLNVPPMSRFNGRFAPSPSISDYSHSRLIDLQEQQLQQGIQARMPLTQEPFPTLQYGGGNFPRV
ncbi:hypothetical protein EV359DRAFT_64446 [Lentinula novae-zelandiae]|nr:hypothetical protein EV359DRAFT_64446 [Lentinula novae-zelandiae]